MRTPTLRPMAAAAIVDPNTRDTEPAPPPTSRESHVRAARPRVSKQRTESGLLKVIRSVLDNVG